MPKPAITTFSSLAVNQSPTNKDNGLYAPELTQDQIDAIPEDILRNGAIVYNSNTNEFEIYQNESWETINTSAGNVNGPAAASDNNIAVFDGGSGKIIKDSGVPIAPVPVLLLSQRTNKNFSKAPLVTVNEIGNLGHIRFVNDIGIIFVDGLTPLKFITNDFGPDSQVCSLFTGELPSTSSSPSALVELQTTTGALLLSRLTQAEIDALTLPIPGMVVYNTDIGRLSFYTNTGWTTDVTSVSASTSSTGLSITGSPITGSGNFTFTLNPQLQGLAGLSATGLLAQTASGTYAARTITLGTSNNLTLSNGNGVSGNPTIDLKSSITGLTSIGIIGSNVLLNLFGNTISSSGGIADGGLNLVTGGTGTVRCTSGFVINPQAGQCFLQISNLAGTFYTRLQSVATTNTTWNLPPSDSLGFFRSDGAGSLSIVPIIPVTNGGTGTSLTPSNGGIVYSTASTMAILSGTSTAGQVLRSGASSAPSWSTATYPSTTTINQLLYSSSNNIITGLTTANNGVLITDGTGIPSISSTLPSMVQTNITQLGTLVSLRVDNLQIDNNQLKALNPNDSIVISTNGTGALELKGGLSYMPIRLYNDLNSNYVSLRAGNISSNVEWVLPLTDSTGIQFLQSNGSGTLSWGSVASFNSKYIIQTTDAGLPNAQVLASLATGIVKNTTSTGVLSIAIAGTDYYAPGFPTYIKDTGSGGNNNLNIGTGTRQSSQSGNSNTSIGINSQQFNDLGSRNTSCGFGSLGPTSFYNDSTGVGYLAGGANVSNRLTAFGSYAASANTFGNDNCVGGFRAMVVATRGDFNTSWGNYTFENLYNAALVAYAYNSAFGYYAAQSQQMYNNCTFVGAYADASVNNLTNAAAFGYNTKVSISNAHVYGLNSNILHGFGTSSPRAQIHISKGTSSGVGGTLLIENSVGNLSAEVRIDLATYNTAANDPCVRIKAIDDGNASADYVIQRKQSGLATNLLLNKFGIYSSNVNFFDNYIRWDNSSANKKIALFDALNNDHQFIGFGYNSNVCRFQIDNTLSLWQWYAGTSATTSNLVATLTGTGDLVAQGYIYGNVPSGMLYIIDSLSTFPSSGGAIQKIPITTVSAQLNLFTMPVNNRLLYTGTRTILASVTLCITVLSDVVSGDVSYTIYVYKNGVLISGSKQVAISRRDVGATSPVVSITSNSLTQLNSNDYLEAYISVSTGNIIVNQMSLTVTSA